MTPTEAIISRIQKLMALGQSPNEAEAALALARAQELLAKYNLDMAVVDAAAPKGTASTEKREKTRVSRSAKQVWQQQLWKAIAEANFCWYSIAEVYEGKRGAKGGSKVPVKRHMILGRESNVMAVKIMGEYLEDTIERLVTTSAGFTNAERMSRSANSWKRGCADRLVERIAKQAEERKNAAPSANTAGSTAIALRDVYQTEYAANYDARSFAGAYEQRMAEQREYEATREQRERDAHAKSIRQEEEWKEYLAKETPAQKRIRLLQEERERKANGRYWAAQERREQREAGKIDYRSYRSGAAAGDDISLNKQVDTGGFVRIGEED